MNFCTSCGNQLDEGALFCNNCGNAIGEAQQAQSFQAQQPVYQPPVYQPQPVVLPHDHTAEFAQDDVSENKLYAMLIYLLGIAGVIIALIAGKESPYLAFHVKQGLKITVVTAAAAVFTAATAWIFGITAILFSIASVVLAVVKIMCFLKVCEGKSVEPAIIRDFKFLS